MTPLLWAFDIVLAAALVLLALAVLSAENLFRSIVLFIVFGLTMALAWARLGAVDIGLVEAAIGAGLTGALLLNALGHMRSEADFSREPARPMALHLSLLLTTAVVGVSIGWAVWEWPAAFVGLGGHVDAELEASGAGNPVTAVLLNFRAYDTLLEVGVLVLAVVAVWSLTPLHGGALDAEPPGPVLDGFVRVLLPAVVLVSGYLLWIGTEAPGGAFQAGAVLAAAGVLLLITGRAPFPRLRTSGERAAEAMGLLVFVGVGVAVMPGGRAFLEFPPERARELILTIETLLTLSIAIMLVILFAGGRVGRDRGRGGAAR
jgi:multisubunit Na+/H+ antiporter MnhB subunit